MNELHVHNPRWYEVSSAIGFGGQRRRVYDGLVRRSGVRPGDRVLDVGSGTGYLSGRAALAVGPSGHVDGVDPSAPVVGYANERAPANASFRVAGAERLPFDDASFDLALSCLAVHHIPKAERARAFGELFRVLKPGGRLLVADFRPPTGRLSRLAVTAFSGHGAEDVRLTDLAVGAGFFVVETGRRAPLLSFVRASRPGG
ncbi:class I SAM-dependent methyltransferase [Kribbella sp. CA-247076]|uniref:class I SAM-dependent methyltransferase n=1 Tax=Kribbella sp. CA-247076 TaxID=3239941 RepID=UPI003D8E7E05